jgi:hypothetical protein
MNQQKTCIEDLKRTRINLVTELKKAMRCNTPKQKIALYNEWQSKYSKHHIDTMVGIIKDKHNLRKIIEWDIDN